MLHFLLNFQTQLMQLIMSCFLDIGFDELACNWWHSHLLDQQQCVVIETAKGVPQGPFQGPMKFTLHTNDIGSATLDIHLYADDTILYHSADTVQC